LRNHGRSPHHPEHTYQLMALDIEEFMASENISKAHILGHSMGGKTAMLFAAQHPERIKSLIVVDVSPEGYANLTQYSPLVVALLNVANAMLSVDFAKYTTRTEIGNDLAQTIKDVNVRGLIMKNLYRNANNTFSWKLNINAVSKALPSIVGPINLEKINDGKPITGFPVLFIKAEHSDYLPDNQIDLIKRFFPVAEIKTILGAGHWIHSDKPELFLKVLEEFLER
jgi:esterase